MVRQGSLVILGLISLCVLLASNQTVRPQESGRPSETAANPKANPRSTTKKGPPIDEKPYRIRAWLSVAPGTPLDAKGRAELITAWQEHVKRFVGEPWSLEVAEGEGPLLNGRLDELTAEAVAPLAQGFDKAWIFEARPLPGSFGLSFSGREYDTATGVIGLVFDHPSRSPADAARNLFDLCLNMFSPTAEIGAQSEGGVNLRVQGSSLLAANPVGRVVSVGSVFRAARVIYNPDGSVRQVTLIPRTYMQVESINGPEARCAIISKLRDPLTRLVRGKYKVVAVGLKPTALPTRLRFVTVPPQSRPAAGYTVTARPAPRGPARVVGTTDREGRVVLEPRFLNGLALVRVLAAGVEPLDEFPIIPGEQVEERLVVIDPKTEAVTLESRLNALRDILVDQAANRARLEALIKPRAEAENWDEVRALLDEYAKLPKRAEFEAQLAKLREEAATQQQETRRLVLTRTAQNMLNETAALVERYIDDDAFAAYEDAYDRYAKTAPPEKARSRTLATDRPESALSRLAITSASNASQDEAKVGLVEYFPPDRAFRLALPPGGTPAASTKELTLSTGAKVTQQILTLEDPQRGTFTLTYFDYDRPPTRDSAISKALDSARAMFLSNARRSRVINERPITLAGYPGREVETEVPAETEGGLKSLSRNRAFVVGSRFYTVSISGTEAMVRARLAELFLDSFRPLTPRGPDSKPGASAASGSDLPATTGRAG